ncbi:MAG: hypothetical protein HY270_20385 [Deltaproteobacteria bacterium]|nr:hypothetical protein [Deltaproteobacteria bacterium]
MMRASTRLSAPQIVEDDQQTRLEEVGTRLAQVAHEVRVPVSLILGSMQTLEQYTTASLAYIRATNERVPKDE